MSVVGVDVDGVLANFFPAYEAMYIEITGEDKFGENKWPNQIPQVWSWPEAAGYTAEDTAAVWEAIRTDPFFWLKLKAHEGADKFLDRLQDSEHEIYFITDRPGIQTQLQTQAWLNAWGFPYANVIISRKGKGAVCSALSITHYIDDKGENILDVRAKSPATSVYCLNYPYNAQFQFDDLVTRCSSLDVFADALGLSEGSQGEGSENWSGEGVQVGDVQLDPSGVFVGPSGALWQGGTKVRES